MILHKTRYPVLFLHGIGVRDVGPIKAFRSIQKRLEKEGYTVFVSKIDSFGTLETNSQFLKEEIEELLKKENAEKVNLVAHSKGGLDSRYLISKLDMEDKVASLTTIATPHRGSEVADGFLNWPEWILSIMNFFINLYYRILGDKKPNAYEVCKCLSTEGCRKFNEEISDSDKVYYASYSTRLNKNKDDKCFSIARVFFKKLNEEPNDGMVRVSSMIYGDYKGDATEYSISHRQIIEFASRKHGEAILNFYETIFEDLIQRGF